MSLMENHIILFLLALSNSAMSIPTENCFQGGHVVKHEVMNHGVTNLCLKDDVSILKISSTQQRNKTMFDNTVSRFWNVKNWHKCNPVPVIDGTFIVYDIDKFFNVVPKVFSCKSECRIHIDKDEGCIILSSEHMNHYTISGTSTTTGWFRSKTNIPLQNTCEHITISCGTNRHTVHACFKTHMSCIRFFKNTILPNRMSKSFCSNIEVILITSFALITYIILLILSGTYIIYLLLPIMWPITYIFGKLYSKSCVKCRDCSLPMHPLSKCGTECMCGTEFGTTERLKKHRESQLCKGYKSGPAARTLCKNKGSNLVLSIFLSVIFFSFLTPINAECYTIDEITDVLLNNPKSSSTYFDIQNIIIWSISFSILIIVMLYKKLEETYTNKTVLHCTECSMFHRLHGLKRNGDFTNKCESCICGFTANFYHEPEGEYETINPYVHTLRESCLYSVSRNFQKLFKIFIVVVILLNSMSPVFGTCIHQDADLLKCGAYNLTDDCEKNRIHSEIVEKAKEFLHPVEMNVLDIMRLNISTIQKYIEVSNNMHYKIIIEKLLYTKYCKYFTNLFNGNAEESASFRFYLYTHQLSLCVEKPIYDLCRCLARHINCHAASIDVIPSAVFYKLPNGHYNHDLNIALRGIYFAFRGIVGGNIYMLVKEKKTDTLVSYLESFLGKINKNFELKAIIEFSINLLKMNIPYTLDDHWPEIGVPENLPQARGINARINISIGDPIYECNSAYIVSCTSKLPNMPNMQFYECDNKHYRMPAEGGVFFKNRLCVGDTFCIKQFQPVFSNLTIGGLVCIKSNPQVDTVWSKESKSCEMEDIGHCLIKNLNTSLILCSDNKLYHTDKNIQHSGSSNIVDYCFSKDCSKRRPINPLNVQNCIWDSNKMHKLGASIINYQSIESYKQTLETTIEGDLNIHKFVGTSKYPIILPTYKSIYIQGVENDNGIENAYIQGEIPIFAGSSNGLHIYTKEGNIIFDVIIYVKQAEYTSTYNEIYKTGPTIGINTRHNEECTGKCPSHFQHHRKNWIYFSREHTSTWGCEEFGCLAIGVGCVYGECQDIIRPEASVFKKETDDQPNVEFCIVLSHKSECTHINILQPIMTDHFEFMFENTEVQTMPELVFIKKNKVFVGQINDVNGFAKECGNVKMINREVIGDGDPIFDYLCYPMHRKDIVVKKCYTNSYHMCTMLREDKTLIFNPNNSHITIHKQGLKLGTLKYKVKLGDVLYKQYVNSIQIDGQGKCVGNIHSSSGISCEIVIDSNGISTCRIESNCKPSHVNTEIIAGNQKLFLKMQCYNNNPVSIRICNIDLKIESHLSVTHETIDITHISDSHYIIEKDEKCKTWLCKAVDEGISNIFDGFLTSFTKYFYIAYCYNSSCYCSFVNILYFHSSWEVHKKTPSSSSNFRRNGQEISLKLTVYNWLYQKLGFPNTITA
ncbi:polyprotein [Oyo virus]|uniref:Envelopment polyprotein n=1 Tax=Oyo virus TaxID=1027632 RepID=I1STB7_9VIRU|nr:polyprotein [Oyo virus]AEE01390.1 polyprotein [Oyo virus]